MLEGYLIRGVYQGGFIKEGVSNAGKPYKRFHIGVSVHVMNEFGNHDVETIRVRVPKNHIQLVQQRYQELVGFVVDVPIYFRAYESENGAGVEVWLSDHFPIQTYSESGQAKPPVSTDQKAKPDFVQK